MSDDIMSDGPISDGMADHGDVRHLFVYGTLRPGEVRWRHLEPYVVGEGLDTFVAGDVYDTGLEYPAARFGGSGRITGRIYELVRRSEALAHLDEVEGAVRGLYRRVVVRSESGHAAWAYECGEDALLVRHLEHGDWAQR
jgi:gamma-glutamylcyclotransferase (GGCT)/AIG2-like uncharacterized protein YtfP